MAALQFNLITQLLLHGEYFKDYTKEGKCLDCRGDIDVWFSGVCVLVSS